LAEGGEQITLKKEKGKMFFLLAKEAGNEVLSH